MVGWPGLDGTEGLCNYIPMRIDKVSDGSPIVFRLDVGSGVPPYLQLVHQVEDALRLGYLREGDRLPRVKDVVINPNTVLKAYKELEQKGLAGGRPGLGTFAKGGFDVVPLADRSSLRRKLTRWISDAYDAGLDDDSIRALISVALHDARRGGSSEAAS
jgi:GntR family transcriptional regulator